MIDVVGICGWRHTFTVCCHDEVIKQNATYLCRKVLGFKHPVTTKCGCAKRECFEEFETVTVTLQHQK